MLKQFYSLFKDSYLQTFDDTKQDRAGFTMTFPIMELKEKIQKIKTLNEKGAGIFFTPNPCKAGRKENNVTEIRWVYVDMDEGTKEEMVEKIKNAPIPPSIVTESSRSYHAYWRLTSCTDEQFKKIINGLIEFFDGDPAISSKNEVLRLPGFNHMKKDPFQIKIVRLELSEESPEDMIEAYPYEPPMEKFTKKFNLKTDELGIIKDLDIKLVLARLGIQVSRDNFIMEGNEKTSASVNVKGNYIHRFSGKQGSGSTIDAVMTYGRMDKAEAIKWLKDMAGIENELRPESVARILAEPEAAKKDCIDEDSKVFTWGTDNLNKNISPIQKHHMIVLLGKTGQGKTTFCFDIAEKNSRLGHKVLFLSLEMTKDEIETRLARSSAGIKKAEWREKTKISDHKKEIYKKRREELKDNKNLILRGFPREIPATTENIFATISKIKPDLVFIDNFDLIAKNPKATEYGEQNRIISELTGFAQTENIPLIILHHHKKGKETDLDSARGSGKITHNPDTVLILSRGYDENASEEDNAKLLVRQEKDRDFGELYMTNIFFYRGSFYDEYPKQITNNQWYDKI